MYTIILTNLIESQNIHFLLDILNSIIFHSFSGAYNNRSVLTLEQTDKPTSIIQVDIFSVYAVLHVRSICRGSLGRLR